ncbi:hypothetical protein [Neptuniibacter halophilus]|uniref:hypothetical protein n=1 Tax=Neptuniibacter halophilus TaxID=651666 RepID=UPI00257327D4|nr:hypothetical protein [Neptuniibacter halophilus]
MRFITTEQKVHCIRLLPEGEEQTVVTFDIGIDTVAPHVAALLSQREIEELEKWLADRSVLRQEIKKRTPEEVILGAFPGLICEATEALKSRGHLSQELKQELKSQLKAFKAELEAAEVSKPVKRKKLEKIGKKEQLKMKLKAIKGKL